jgi:hypothetical protein
MYCVNMVPADAPPPFLGLVAHPLRWSLLTALGRSDLRVRELTVFMRPFSALTAFNEQMAARLGAAEG